MRKSKLVDVCQALRREEWRELEDFVASPYFNKKEEVILFCAHLHHLAKRGFPAAAMKREVVWEALFPGQAFDKKAMAYLMSDLLQMMESYLGQQEFEHQAQRKEMAILTALSERKLDKSYHFRLQRFKRKLKKSPRENANYYHHLYMLADLEDAHFNAQNLRQENPYFSVRNLALDQYYVQSKLRLFCNMLNQAAVIGSDYELTWPADPTSSPTPLREDTLTETYRCLFQLLQSKEPNDVLFDRYNSLLADIQEKTDAKERISLYYFAINYCLQALKKGRREYADKLLLLYQNGLSSQNLFVNGELSPWIYKNIVKLSLGLKQFDWVERFITEYSEKLPAQDRHDALYFNLSDLKYHQRAYDEALGYLNQVEFSDIFYKHGTKIMLLKIYFEKKETEAFFSLASSYKLMLLREKGLSSSTLNAYKNFVRLAVKLYKAHERPVADWPKLREEIERSKNINARQWLLAQISAG